MEVGIFYVLKHIHSLPLINLYNNVDNVAIILLLDALLCTA